MEQAPDELSGKEGETSEEEVNDISDKPMNDPAKEKDADVEETGGCRPSTRLLQAPFATQAER